MERSSLRSRGLAVALAALLAPAQGCSGIFVKRVPWGPVEADKPVACTTSRAAPILDIVGTGILAGFGTFLAIGALDAPVCASPGETDCLSSEGERWAYVGLGAAAVLSGLLYAMSAASGFKATADCEQVRALQTACVGGDASACSRLSGAPPPAKAAAPDG